MWRIFFFEIKVRALLHPRLTLECLPYDKKWSGHPWNVFTPTPLFRNLRKLPCISQAWIPWTTLYDSPGTSSWWRNPVLTLFFDGVMFSAPLSFAKLSPGPFVLPSHFGMSVCVYWSPMSQLPSHYFFLTTLASFYFLRLPAFPPSTTSFHTYIILLKNGFILTWLNSCLLIFKISTHILLYQNLSD